LIILKRDQGKTFARRDENSPGLSKDKSDQLEDATGDHDFDKAILALITPQEQERNVDDTQVNADPWEDLFCIEPCTSMYTDLASAKPSSGQATNCVQMMPHAGVNFLSILRPRPWSTQIRTS
jgi:hypothetical protein